MSGATFDSHKAYLAATTGLQFTKDFNNAIAAVMNDELASPAQRVLAWAKFRAWGKQREFCVRDDGNPAVQKDCAADLKLHKSTVSKTYAYLETRGYVRLEGKLLYPVLSPELTPPPDRKVSDSETFASYLEVWKVANSATFDEWQVADATVKRCKLVALRDYRDEMARKQSAAASLLTKTSEDFPEENERTNEHPPLLQVLAPPEPQPVRSFVPPPEPEPEPPREPTIRDQLGPWLTEHFDLPLAPDAAILDQISPHLPDTATFERFKFASADVKPKNWALFVRIAERAEITQIAENARIHVLKTEQEARQRRLAEVWEPYQEPEEPVPKPPGTEHGEPIEERLKAKGAP